MPVVSKAGNQITWNLFLFGARTVQREAFSDQRSAISDQRSAISFQLSASFLSDYMACGLPRKFDRRQKAMTHGKAVR